MAKTVSGSSSVVSGSDYLTRAEVLAVLQIKSQTLYAYVSRGLIRSMPQPGGRSSFYSREDVERIKIKGAARAGFGAVAASAMRWGDPVITTSITQLTEAGPRYRNRLATDLVRAHASFETVADFLWAGNWIDKADGWGALQTPPEVIAQLSRITKLRAQPHVVQLLILAVGMLGVYHGSYSERTKSGATQVLLARQAIWTMTGVFGFLGPRRQFVAMHAGQSVAAGLAQALGIKPTPNTLRAINAILVLDVDHELTPSAFAARIAASSAADLHACIGAALNTHHSGLTGNRADSVEELLEPRASSSTMIARVKTALASAQRVPGFDHPFPFYPNGDPRAKILIEIAREIGRSKRSVRDLIKTVEVLEGQFGLRPSFEFGSVMLCRALGLPAQTSSGLRSLARSAGWVAHAFEQRLAAFMIRPRAKYVDSATLP